MPATPSLFQTWFPPEEFAVRRAQLFDRLGDAHALVQGGGPVRGFDPFRQTNDFFYLCGVEVPQSYLLLNGATRTAQLFVPPIDPGQARSEGESLHHRPPAEVCELTGLDEVHEVRELEEHLTDAKVLYVSHRPAEGRAACQDTLRHAGRVAAADPWDGGLTREGRFLELLRMRFPGVEIRDLAPWLHALRLVKSPREVELVREASRLCGMAVMEAMRSTRPGVMEYQLGALANYVYLVNGALGESYRAIIAGGHNAWFGHYYRNNCELRDGDLVLLDHAPDYGYYTTDIGRMWPVNGRYGELHRQLYGFVVRYHKAVLNEIRAGRTVTEIHESAAAAMEPVLSDWTFSKPEYQAAARNMLTFQGHLSHPVGMAVHDVGNYRTEPLVPGLVFAVDPQMWVPEEELYIRCEDTVAVTETGCDNLTGFVPLELAEVETLMREDGLLQLRPDLLR